MKTKTIVSLILRCVAVGAGVAVLALSCMGKIETASAVWLLALGLACLAVNSLSEHPQPKDED